MAEKSCRINLRVTPEEKAAWEKAAEGRLSDWLRDLANGSLSRWVDDEPLPRITTQIPLNEIAPLPEGLRPKRSAGTTAQKCPRWMHHRPGVFCSSCP